MKTEEIKLFVEISRLVDEWGITAVTSALFDKVESKKDQFIKDYYGTAWKVIDKHGNRITLVEVL